MDTGDNLNCENLGTKKFPYPTTIKNKDGTERECIIFLSDEEVNELREKVQTQGTEICGGLIHGRGAFLAITEMYPYEIEPYEETDEEKLKRLKNKPCPKCKGRKQLRGKNCYYCFGKGTV